MTKLKPYIWCQLVNQTILDPDGWDRKAENFEKDWNTSISFTEFILKSGISTTQYNDKFTYILMHKSKIAPYIFYYGNQLKREKTSISGMFNSSSDFTFNLETNEIFIKIVEPP